MAGQPSGAQLGAATVAIATPDFDAVDTGPTLGGHVAAQPETSRPLPVLTTWPTRGVSTRPMYVLLPTALGPADQLVSTGRVLAPLARARLVARPGAACLRARLRLSVSRRNRGQRQTRRQPEAAEQLESMSKSSHSGPPP